LPTVGAGPALARFADGRPTIPEKMPEPLVITGVQLGTATFPTDRGPLALPAWLFSLPQATGALAVPALADSAFWHLGDVPPAATAASLVGGLAVQIAQPPATACPGEPIYRYDVVAAESPTAVVVQLRKTQTGVAAGSPQPCDQPLFLRLTAYPVHLVDPLGNRVLLDPFGRVYQVSTTLSLPD
jgi:hypothetical protein